MEYPFEKKWIITAINLQYFEALGLRIEMLIYRLISYDKQQRYESI